MHPNYTLTAESLLILRLWQRQRGGEGRSVVMPRAGGLLDQPAYLINAFGHMDAVASQIEAARRNART